MALKIHGAVPSPKICPRSVVCTNYSIDIMLYPSNVHNFDLPAFIYEVVGNLYGECCFQFIDYILYWHEGFRKGNSLKND